MKGMKRLCCLILSILMAVSLAGCAKEEDTVVATVNGENIYLYEVDNLYEQNLQTYQDQTGVDLTLNSSTEKREAFRQALLEDLIKDTAVIMKAKEMGYSLTDAEKEAVDAEYDDLLKRNAEFYAERDYAGQADAYEKGVKAFEDYMASKNLNEEKLKKSMYDNKVHEKLMLDLLEKENIDYEAAEESYKAALAQQEKDFTADASVYEEYAVADSARVLYNLPGYIRVRYILIPYADEIGEKIVALDSENAQYQLDILKLMQEKGPEDSGVKAIEKKIQANSEKMDELQTKGMEKTKEEAEAVYQELMSSGDFDMVMQKYNKDATMQTYPYNVTGILMGKNSNYAQNIIDQAFALKNEGDITELFGTTGGYMILQLVKVIEEGPVAYEGRVKELYEQLATADVSQTVLGEFQNTALEGLEIVRYINRL